MSDTKPTVYLASDHAGFDMKNELLTYLEGELGYQVVDCGAKELNSDDDYPDFVSVAAKSVAEAPAERRGIVLGGSGQGEAIAANRFAGVRAVVYYGSATEQTDATGERLDLVTSTRVHNDANVLSLGARFISIDEARVVVKKWLETPFNSEERHQRRIGKLDQLDS